MPALEGTSQDCVFDLQPVYLNRQLRATDRTPWQPGPFQNLLID